MGTYAPSEAQKSQRVSDDAGDLSSVAYACLPRQFLCRCWLPAFRQRGVLVAAQDLAWKSRRCAVVVFAARVQLAHDSARALAGQGQPDVLVDHFNFLGVGASKSGMEIIGTIATIIETQ